MSHKEWFSVARGGIDNEVKQAALDSGASGSIDEAELTAKRECGQRCRRRSSKPGELTPSDRVDDDSESDW